MAFFDTISPTNTQAGYGGELVDWHDGTLLNRTSNIYIHYGTAKTWDRDVNWNITRNQGRGLHFGDAYTISGENGRSHEAIYEQNVSGHGRFIPMKFIKGFSINTTQDSTAGHGMYLYNAGIEFVKNDGTKFRWGSRNLLRLSNYNETTLKFEFSPSDQQEMAQDGALFHKFLCRLSTDGGTGTRSSSVKLGAFRLLYDDTGCTTGRWIIPGKRSYDNRLSPGMLAA